VPISPKRIGTAKIRRALPSSPHCNVRCSALLQKAEDETGSAVFLLCGLIHLLSDAGISHCDLCGQVCLFGLSELGLYQMDGGIYDGKTVQAE
jgi:hypothetical protein